MDDTIKTILYSWKEKQLPKIHPRDTTLESYGTLQPRKIIVITGFRRVGKTYLLLNFIATMLKKMDREQVVYINFDDERIPEKTEFLTSLLPLLRQTFTKKTRYLFLDEIQNMPKWSKWLRRIYEHETMGLFITGSSSKVSSREIPTELRGRCLEVHLFPLSFAEFLRFKQKKIDLPAVAYSENEQITTYKLLEEYIEYGGMPEVVLAPIEKKTEILQQYYGTVVSRDIIERYNVGNEEGLKALLQLLLNSTHYSISRLYATLKSLHYEIGKTTVLTYLGYIESSYFIQSVPIFSYKIKDQLQYPRKIYFIDNGFITSLSTRYSKNTGRLYENLVAIELLRRTATSTRAIYYWKDRQGKNEVDFVIKDGLTVHQILQVCYDVEYYETKKRETRSLIKASEELNCSNLLIITKKYEAVEKLQGKKIHFVPLYKWLLSSL